jgi:hypothetical protein
MGVRYEDYSDTGEAVPLQEDAARWLPIGNRATMAEFEWWHLPAGWAHHDGIGWVPQPCELYYKPGANGVGGDILRPLIGPARTGMAGKGGILLDRRKVPGGDYVVRHRTRSGRWHHTDRWTTYTVLGNRLQTKCDIEGRARWLLSLATAGVIDAMPRLVLDQALQTLDHRLERLQNDPRTGNMAVAAKMATAEKKRAAMIADYERQFGATTPEAK